MKSFICKYVYFTLIFAVPSWQSPLSGDDAKPGFVEAVKQAKRDIVTPTYSSSSHSSTCPTPTSHSGGVPTVIHRGLPSRSVKDTVYANPIAGCNVKGREGLPFSDPCNILGSQSGGDVLQCQQLCKNLVKAGTDCQAYQFNFDALCTVYSKPESLVGAVVRDTLATGYFSNGGSTTDTDCYSATPVDDWSPQVIP